MPESALSLAGRLRAALDRTEEIARATEVSDGPDQWWSANDLGAHVDEADTAFIVANGPASVLRSVAAHRKILERYETAVIARDAAVDTPLAGATRMALRLARETLEIVAAVYFPEETTDGT